jgi:uncharacterized protein
MSRSSAPVRREPRRYSRATLSLVYAFEKFCRVVLRGRALYARQLARSLRVRHERIVSPRLPRAFDGLRLAHLSDFHAGPFLDAESLRPVIDRLVALAPDVVVLTGDYLTHVAEEGIALAAAFAHVRPRLGGYLVFGNHDYRHRREGEIAAAFEPHGFRALRNSAAILGDAATGRIVIAGIEDIEEGKVIDLDAALAARREGDFTILLAHHPDVATTLAGRSLDLVLAGHTHGGQIVFGGRSIFPGALRSVFSVGVHQVSDFALGVTSGIGVLVAPLRFNAPPEIVVYELRRAS